MSVSEAIPGTSRLRNQNEILIEKSDEAFCVKKNSLNKQISKKPKFIADTAITRREAIQY